MYFRKCSYVNAHTYGILAFIYIYIYIHIHIHTYIYIYVCVCVFVHPVMSSNRSATN